MPNDQFSIGTVLDPTVTRLALAGLRATPKTLPPQLFYDEEGCRLFYRITGLPEYYLTRTEWSLLSGIALRIATAVPTGAVLVEYGASHEAKAARLLAARDRSGARVFASYVAIDVAAPALQAMRTRLAITSPDVAVHIIVGDFEQPVTLPESLAGRPRLGFFPGSTIGNLDPAAAQRFLELARDELGAGSQLLLGVDLRKPAAAVVPAYDDAAGVTAAFNRNLLVRLNREAGADFEPFNFAHRAVWNDVEGRIEMHLVSRCDQVVRIAGESIAFVEGETIHTENSYKFTPDAIRALAESAGWTLRDRWFDEARRYGMFLLAAC
ncbi:MAG: L-histidine N(alpha)-methyltransferase [Acetobacteraceae bacterium]|nr:L-histidine N(alpha)-methyltransferase [Acetobacteraceae bacterium]